MQHSKSPVGSMTMAMKAVRAEGRGPKVLRLGVLEGSRITEERIVREQDMATVTIGRDPSCTIIVSTEGAPEKQPLFVRQENHWALALFAGLEGRVLMDAKVHAVADITAARGAGSTLALDESTRGKVSLGSTSVLFQFVEPPPVAPKPQLPSAILHKPLRELDWRYNACLAGFMALGFTGLGYVEYGYDPEIESVDIREEARLVRIDAAPPTIEPAEAMAAPEERPNQSAPSQPSSRSNSSTRNQTARSNSGAQPSRDAQIAQAAQQAERAIAATMSGLERSMNFQSLAQALGGDRSAQAMIRNGQGLMDTSMESLANVTGITNGADRPGISRSGVQASAGQISGHNLGGPRRVDGPAEIASNATAPVERVIRTRVTSGAIDGPATAPGMPMNEVAAVFRRNLGAVQSCYTAALRNNSGLRGRLEVEFTIGTSGRVTGSPNVSGIANGDEVHQCVARRVRSFVFPQLSEAAEVMFPVTLEPGG